MDTPLPFPQVRTLSWGARLLYVGPVIALSEHANAVAELTVALDGDLELFSPEIATPLRCRSVFVPAGRAHTLQFHGSRIACLYVDVASIDVEALLSRMTSTAGVFAFNHADEAALIDLCETLLADRIPRGSRRTTVASVLGLSQPGEIDPRIGQALRLIHAAPDEPHRCLTLAKHTAMSPVRFRHAFREATGVPLSRYRVWVRLMSAMKSAINGSSLTDAAHGSGFSSSAHFSSAYRKMFGMSASTYLQAIRPRTADARKS